jgi:hypothetical protein
MSVAGVDRQLCLSVVVYCYRLSSADRRLAGVLSLLGACRLFLLVGYRSSRHGFWLLIVWVVALFVHFWCPLLRKWIQTNTLPKVNRKFCKSFFKKSK